MIQSRRRSSRPSRTAQALCRRWGSGRRFHAEHHFGKARMQADHVALFDLDPVGFPSRASTGHNRHRPVHHRVAHAGRSSPRVPERRARPCSRCRACPHARCSPHACAPITLHRRAIAARQYPRRRETRCNRLSPPSRRHRHQNAIRHGTARSHWVEYCRWQDGEIVAEDIRRLGLGTVPHGVEIGLVAANGGAQDRRLAPGIEIAGRRDGRAARERQKVSPSRASASPCRTFSRVIRLSRPR